jgi:hypothetical protein
MILYVNMLKFNERPLVELYVRKWELSHINL